MSARSGDAERENPSACGGGRLQVRIKSTEWETEPTP